MKSKFLLIVSILSFTLNSFADDCDQAEAKLKTYLNSLHSNTCHQDSDCKAYIISPTPCTRLYIANTEFEKLINSEEIQSLKKQITKACTSRWALMGACVPHSNELPVQCKNNLCIEGVSNTTIESKAKFSYATMQSSCAPTDAASISIIAHPNDSEFPMLSINWWSTNRPKFEKGIYKINASDTRGYYNDFSAVLCPYQSNCKTFKEIKINVDIDEKLQNNSLEYDIMTIDGLNLKGKIPLKIEKTRQIICG